MKKTKKILFFVTCMLCLVSVISFRMKANATTSDNGKGSWDETKSEAINVYGMDHLSIWGNATDTKPQHINVLSMKTDGYSSKLVSWSVTSGNKKYTRQTLDVIAKDYEEKHPGWIVVGGINGDQYTTGFGSDVGAGSSHFYPQTYYPLIMDGESRIPITVQNSSAMHVGFANDGSENSLIPASNVRCFVLSIVDEYKNVIAKFDINKINEAPGTNEITAWSTYMSISKADTYVNQEISTTNNVYVVENPELAYMNNSATYIGGVNSLFGKGTITKVTNSVVLTSNQFAIETTNPEVIAALSEGKRIIVDAEFENEALNKVEASTGFHSVHRMNGVDQPLVHTGYDGTRYSRAIIGKKADGTYVLFTADVANDPNDTRTRYVGLNFDECNAALKHYGVTEAYQMDGGGSVTSIYRDENGEFVISNYVRDGVRANMTGLLFVVRDPQVSVKEITHNSVTLKQEVLAGGITSTIEDLTLSYNGQTYKFDENGEVTVSGLEENTEYEFALSYNAKKVSQDGTETGEVKAMTSKVKAQTKLYEGPTPQIQIQNITKRSFVIKMEPVAEIKNAKVAVDGREIDLVDGVAVIDGLIDDTDYVVVLKYEIVDPTTSKVYYRESKQYEVKTLDYDVPTITEFIVYRSTANRITFQYGYADESELVVKAQLVYGENVQELDSKSGMVSITNLDLNNNLYEFKIVLTYKLNGTEKEVVSEIIKAGKETQVGSKYTITYEVEGGELPEDAPTEYVEGEGLTTLPKPTKEGYKFEGWYLNGKKVTSISKTLTEDVVLTAKWSEKTSNAGGSCNFTAVNGYLLTFVTLLGGLVIVLRKRK